ncbi:MAG: hypothetical protein CMN29_18920 [Sandaracinus sp.]|nr:hypothetical protein [Myxococcales bacterium]MAT26992.1 hypothetical protein [Sandaracinus sp.]
MARRRDGQSFVESLLRERAHGLALLVHPLPSSCRPGRGERSEPVRAVEARGIAHEAREVDGQARPRLPGRAGSP